MWQTVHVDSAHETRAPGLPNLAESLLRLMGLVAPPERVATIARVLTGETLWRGAEEVTKALESAGIDVTAPEQDALEAAESIIGWARRDRRKVTLEELSTRWRLTLGGLEREVLEVALLDTAGRLIPDGVVRAHEGGVDRIVVHPRRIMELALRHGAARLVLAHNHPSGDVNPTRRDRDATRQIVLAGTTLDVSVADHLIVSPQATFSFRKEDLL